MVTKNMKSFMSMAGKFVEKNKGKWDHEAWLDFISEAQKMGIEMCDDTKACAGAVLESMKNYYATTMETKGMTNVMGEMTDNTLKFLKDTKGMWDHKQWETYLKSMQEKGTKMNDESKNYLAAIVEATKQFASISKMNV